MKGIVLAGEMMEFVQVMGLILFMAVAGGIGFILGTVYNLVSSPIFLILFWLKRKFEG